MFFFLFISLINSVLSLKIDLISQPYDAYVDISSYSPHRFLQSSISSSTTFSDKNDNNEQTNFGKGRRKPGFLESSFVSPSNGTDVLYRPIQLIKCENQTKCIQPELQLVKKITVYYCKRVSYGIRFYYLVREGLLLHPNIQMVDDPKTADIVLYLPESAAWEKSECNNPAYANKLVVLDESDGPHMMEIDSPNPWYLLYFKRSYVNRHNGIFKGYMGYVTQKTTVFPITYPIGEAYVRTLFPTMEERDIEIVCTLRENNGDRTRGRVKSWVNEYARNTGLSNIKAQEINHASRTTIDTAYFNQMFRARIIVTVNPAGWEGDFRFMEAMASGSLVFIDHMHTPRHHPLIHGVHVIYYDNNNQTDLWSKLDYYRKETKLSRSIAISGYLHAMKYHRAACFLDYIFRTVHVAMNKKLESTQQEVLNYKGTGYDLREIAVQRQKRWKETSIVPPGIR